MALSMVWDWKVEPVSPGLMDINPSEDVWLFEDDIKEVTIEIDDDEKLCQPTTKGEVASKLLDDLNEWIKEEPFNDWLEEKIDLPIFEELPPIDQRSKYKSLDTQTLLQEFETVFGEVESNNGALTPPQSPPHVQQISTYTPEPEVAMLHHLGVSEQDQNIKLQSNDLMHLIHDNIPEKVTYSVNHDGDIIILQTLNVPKAYQPIPEEADLSMETTCVLDELVRSRAADIDTSSDPWEMTSASSAQNESSETEFVLSPPESGSENSNFEIEACDDSEWVPSPVNSKVTAPKRKRAKPYTRATEDKKLRKKEQNKNAATRYRQKKKAEVDVIMEEEKGLVAKNVELHKNVEEISREIKYLKGLMRDLFKAKGLLK